MAEQGIVTGSTATFGKAPSKKKKLLIIGLVVVLVAGAATGGYLYWRHRENAKKAAAVPKAIAEQNKTAQDAVSNIGQSFQQQVGKASDQTSKLKAEITYISYLSGTGKHQEALDEALKTAKTYPADLVKKNGVNGLIWGQYDALGDKAKAAEYKQKYLDDLNATGQQELAKNIESGNTGMSP